MPGPGPFEMVAAKLVEARVALEQVAWATVDTDGVGGASRITLHMVDGTTFLLRDAEAQRALEGLGGTPG